MRTTPINDPVHLAPDVADFAARRDREKRRFHARLPKQIDNVMAQLITTCGYGRLQADATLSDAWQAAAGQGLARFSRPGRLRRGVLEVTVTNSAILQELTFEKQQLLAKLRADAPIRDIRFRIGTVD